MFAWNHFFGEHRLFASSPSLRELHRCAVAEQLIAYMHTQEGERERGGVKEGGTVREGGKEGRKEEGEYTGTYLKRTFSQIFALPVCFDAGRVKSPCIQ